MQTTLEEVLAEARRHSLTRQNPLLETLPAFFSEFRDHQRVAIREILTAYEEGAECVVLDAPTGSGKTLIGETVRRLLANPPNGQTSNDGVLLGRVSKTSTYICSSKALQDQFLHDYPYAKVLKGRSNYATESYPERFGGKDGLSCADCTKSPGDSESCLWCSDTHICPYEMAKSDALRASLAVLNTSYFLSECNGPGRFSRGGLVIADEADELESELMSHVEVRISERRLKSYGLGVPRYVTKEESWREWAGEAWEVVRNSRPRVGSSNDLKTIRARKRHDILVGRLDLLRQGLGSGGWVYTGDRQSVAFKPVTVSHLGQEKFWRHGDRFLLMSATVISADELLESLGWDEDKEWRLVKCPSTFPAKNRRVVVWPVASMTYKEKETAHPKICEAVGEIVGRHPGQSVVVHSTSYELTRKVDEYLRGLVCLLTECVWCSNLEIPYVPSGPATVRDESSGGVPVATHFSPRQIISYLSAQEREGAIAEFKSATPGAVLIGPSVGRGIDLPGDLCRVQVIVKVPFLNLQDKQVATRLYGQGLSGKRWYAVSAIRDIVQMTGRATRSETDWCVNYVLDRQFVDNLWSGWRRLFPKWWAESLEWRMKGLG